MTNKKLKEKRNEKGLSQIELANLSNINPNTYVQYELGHRAIPYEVAKELSKILEFDIDDFFVPKYLIFRK